MNGKEGKEAGSTVRSTGSGGTSSSGGGRGGSDGGVVTRRSSVSPKLDNSDELVDGWPKWLTDNVPKDALDGLIPKSADAYDKLDKVTTISHFFFDNYKLIMHAYGIHTSTMIMDYGCRKRKN